MKKDRLLNTQQAAEILNVSVSTLYRIIADGQFIVFKARGSTRILETSIDAYIQRQIHLYAMINGISVSDGVK